MQASRRTSKSRKSVKHRASHRLPGRIGVLANSISVYSGGSSGPGRCRTAGTVWIGRISEAEAGLPVIDATATSTTTITHLALNITGPPSGRRACSISVPGSGQGSGFGHGGLRGRPPLFAVQTGVLVEAAAGGREGLPDGDRQLLMGLVIDDQLTAGDAQVDANVEEPSVAMVPAGAGNPDMTADQPVVEPLQLGRLLAD